MEKYFAIAFDIETLKAQFCICAHDTDGNKYEYSVANEQMVDPSKVRQFLAAFKKYKWVFSYNGAAFDLRVICWIANSMNPISVEEVSDQASLLISDLNTKFGPIPHTSKCWSAKTEGHRKNHFDILKCYTGKHSLKWWELARCWSVKETDVPWDKPVMTESEQAGTLFYCHHDVEATLKLGMEKACLDLIDARQWLIDQCEVPILPDAPMATLSETYTYGNFKGDEEGTVESLIDWYCWDIPTYLIDAFMAIGRGDAEGFVWNGETGKVIFKGSDEYNRCLKIDKGYFTDGWAAYGKGGAHYAKKGLNKDVKIFDVASLYPSIIQHHLPLKCEKAQKRYVDGKLERIRIKRLKGTPEYSKAVDMGLKLNLNSLSGKFRQNGAAAYAPQHGLAMCILGQLLITEATWNAIGKDPKRWNEVIEINTDSFAVIGDDNIERAREYVKKCLDVHKFEFEEEDFPLSYWKDVNHYVVYDKDGSIEEDKGDKELESENILIKSIYDMGKDVETLSEPYLVEVDDKNWTDYLVKFTKTASQKNCFFGDDRIEKKYCYFLYTSRDCPDAKLIRLNGNVEDERWGVMGYDPAEMHQYLKYLDKEQYMDDLRKLCKVWNMDKLATPPIRAKKVKGDDFDEGLF